MQDKTGIHQWLIPAAGLRKGYRPRTWRAWISQGTPVLLNSEVLDIVARDQ
jgi:hypothetical protein